MTKKVWSKSDNVRVFPNSSGKTTQQALLDALGQGLEQVLIVGVDSDDDLVIFSSDITRKDALWLAECAKRHATEED